jgi:filamentous hemagglutinin
LCHLEFPDCSKEPKWLGGASNRRLLLPSESYPESHYGPTLNLATFDYTAPFTRPGIGGKTAPIKPFDIHPTKKLPNDLSGLIGDGQVIDDPAAQWSKIYRADAAVWKVFGVEPPSSLAPNLPKTRMLEEDPESVKDKEKALQAYNDYIAPVHELDRRIRSFNADFERRTVTNFTIDEVNETVRESRTLSTDPALILVNGDARFTGSVVNDKSQIVTGGKLSVDGPDIRNIGATGERRIEHEGTSTRTYKEEKASGGLSGLLGGSKSERRTEEPQPYRAVIAVEPIELPVAVAMGGEAGQAEQKDFISTLQGKHQAFTVQPEADARYLVATDPRLVGQREVVSSDVLLDLLTPEGSKDKSVGKRAGDGFYEQKLVSDQIRVATGQRFLPSFHDNDAQYRALLSAGAELARTEGLKIGEPLTLTQIRQLTADRAWLVRQSVTLPDGTTQQVLVPKVYLKAPPSNTTANPTANTPPGGSTLLAGHDINLSASKDLTNTGTIGARDSSVLTAHTLVNEEGGRIQGNQVEATAKEDLINRAGTITGEAVALRAGRDVVLASPSEYDHQDDGQFSYWSQAISGVSRIEAGRLDVGAYRDIALTATHVTARDDARLKAGRDITLDSLVEGQRRSAIYGANNRMAVSTSSEVGTTISTDHALTLLAGQDVRTRASAVTAGGALTVDAKRDIQLSPGQTKSSAYDERTSKTSGLFSSKKTHSIYALDWTQTQGSTMTGDSVMFNAGRDVNVTGSTVGAQRDLRLGAKGNIAIVSGTNTVEGLQYEQIKKSGFGTSGGVSYGKRDQLDSLESLRTEVVPSTLGSVEGNVQIQGGKTVAVVGSQVLAPQGNLTVMGQKITLDPAIELLREKEVHARSQSGLTLSGSTPVVSGFQVGQRMGQAVRQLGRPADNPVMIALAGLTTGLAAKNTYDALMKDPQHLGGASVMVSVGSSKSRTQTERESSQIKGSMLLAGQDLTLFAQGAGKDSDIVVTGSMLSGGQDVLLKAEGDLLLQAAQNKAYQQTKSKSNSASLGVGLSFGVQKSGLTGELGVSKTRGHADGQDVSWTPSTVTANRLLAIESGGDTTFRGAQGHAKQIVADVDGDLLLESLQDTSTYKGKQANMALSGSMSMTGQGSVSGNVGRQSMKSDFASVISQTGLFAGDGGFQIDVKDHTHLAGAVIKGSEQSIDKGVNQLLTGTLTSEDIQNRADYRASMLSVGGGMVLGGGGGQPGTSDLGTTQDGQVAGGATKTHGTSLATSESGLGMNAPIVMLAKGSDQSTTYSAISDGTVVIRKGLAQRDLTGMTPSETLIALNRDTSKTLNPLKPIFDKKKIEAGFEIVSAFQQQAGQFLTNRALEVDALKARANNLLLSQEERERAVIDAIALDRQWGTGGNYRRVLSAMIAATSGDVSGSTGQLVQATAVNYLQGLGASEVKAIVDALSQGREAETVRAAMHTLVGCVGALGSNQDCRAGALGAGTSSVLNSLLSPQSTEGLSSQEKQAHSNLVSTLVSGVASVTGVEDVTAIVSARTETENNYLKAPQVKELFDDMMVCRGSTDPSSCRKETQTKYEELSRKQGGGKLLYGCKADGEGVCERQFSEVQAGSKALEALGKMDWTSEELAILDPLTQLNYDEDRVADHAWRQSLHADSGITGGILLGGLAGLVTAKAELTVVKNSATEIKTIPKSKEVTSFPIPGKVTGNFDMVTNPGPLPNNMAETFNSGKYIEVILEKDIAMYRVGTSSRPLGEFFSYEAPNGILQSRIDKAILPTWPNGGLSPIDSMFTVKIPAGTKVYVGEVGSQGGFYVGGTQQIVLPQPWKIEGVQVIDSRPLK